MKKRILEDHKKVGKIMVPPIYQHPDMNIQEGHYIEDTLPEIIWMGLIHQELGYKKGIEFIRQVIECISEVRDPSAEYNNFAIASNFYKLSQIEIEAVVKKLSTKGIFLQLSDILSPIIYFYNEHPFKFCNKEVDLTQEEEFDLLHKLKTCINLHADRFKKDSIISMANVMYIHAIEGKLHYGKDMEVPDLDALFNKPDSEEAKRAESHVRNHVKLYLMMHKDTNKWAKTFWNQSYHLDQCEFIEEDYD